MPRGRKRKSSKKNEKKKKINERVPEAEMPKTQALFSEEQYGLSLMESFMKSDMDMIAIAYRVPTGDMGREDVTRRYRSQMISALQTLGKRRGLVISVQHIHFRALPIGEDTIIKAFAVNKNINKARDNKPLEKKEKDVFDWKVNV